MRPGHLIALLLFLAPLAACGGDLRPLPAGGPRLQAALNADGAAVEVFVEDLPPGAVIQEVWLDGPAGSRLSGVILSEIEAPREPSGGARPTVGVGARGGSSSGIDPSLSLSWGAGPAGPVGAWRSSHWLVPVPPALRPGLAGGDWRAELHYRDRDGIVRVMRRGLRG